MHLNMRLIDELEVFSPMKTRAALGWLVALPLKGMAQVTTEVP